MAAAPLSYQDLLSRAQMDFCHRPEKIDLKALATNIGAAFAANDIERISDLFKAALTATLFEHTIHGDRQLRSDREYAVWNQGIADVISTILDAVVVNTDKISDIFKAVVPLDSRELLMKALKRQSYPEASVAAYLAEDKGKLPAWFAADLLDQGYAIAADRISGRVGFDAQLRSWSLGRWAKPEGMFASLNASHLPILDEILAKPAFSGKIDAAFLRCYLTYAGDLSPLEGLDLARIDPAGAQWAVSAILDPMPPTPPLRSSDKFTANLITVGPKAAQGTAVFKRLQLKVKAFVDAHPGSVSSDALVKWGLTPPPPAAGAGGAAPSSGAAAASLAPPAAHAAPPPVPPAARAREPRAARVSLWNQFLNVVASLWDWIRNLFR